MVSLSLVRVLLALVIFFPPCSSSVDLFSMRTLSLRSLRGGRRRVPFRGVLVSGHRRVRGGEVGGELSAIARRIAFSTTERATAPRRFGPVL